jgi:hypothetical protein
MAQKKSNVPTIGVSAKAEVSAKVAYSRTRKTTEVIPPDVTRAKAGAWLELLSPITQWAGLKGDEMAYRRASLRIQQEAALENLAVQVREKLGVRQIKQIIPPKLLIPTLEAVSLEDPQSPLIAWWANLLVSGALGGSTRPYLSELMRVIGFEEASVMSEMWGAYSTDDENKDLDKIIPDYLGYRLRSFIELEFCKSESHHKKAAGPNNPWYSIAGALINYAKSFGIKIYVETPTGRGSSMVIWDENYFETSVEVCRALRLLAEYRTDILFDPESIKEKYARKYTNWHLRVLYPTYLGIEFLMSCQPKAGLSLEMFAPALN